MIEIRKLCVWQHKDKEGFSLLELSVVLVVISLIIGGIVAGNSLRDAAILRDSVTRAQGYIRAVDQFRIKYDALPGNMYNATELWGAQDGGDGLGTDCTQAASSGRATCNGSGSGYLSAVGSTGYEAFRLWQHLSNAGLIEGNFTGVSGMTGINWWALPGENVPKAPIRNRDVGYGIRYEGYGTGADERHFGENIGQHYLMMGERWQCHTHDTDYFTCGGAVSAREAHGIDKKMDDGLPGQGSIVTNYHSSAFSSVACVTTPQATTSKYQLQYEVSGGCPLYFRLDF